ncbi:MAG: ABC transporter permease subunit, partial [Anaerolineae bacterium]
ILLAMAISGGAAGLAGAIEVAGISFRLYQQISPGYGFESIAVSLLANNHPLGIILSGILFGALRSGAEVMQISAKVPSVLVFVIQGLVILCVVAFGLYRLHSRWEIHEDEG